MNINVILFNYTRAFGDDLVFLNHGQVTRTTPELAPPSPTYHTTPTGGRLSSQQATHTAPMSLNLSHS
ncbi:hypothetical protein TNCV_2550241 [Trichonephila clavipes]|nr:hypothetical protein TNCV_2550241 [Trichonephila clavipes]